MKDAAALHETPPETEPSGAESAFITSFQVAHPGFTITEIRSALRHVGLELALEQEEGFLRDAVAKALER